MRSSKGFFDLIIQRAAEIAVNDLYEEAKLAA
jgi:hypothetical protein